MELWQTVYVRHRFQFCSALQQQKCPTHNGSTMVIYRFAPSWVFAPQCAAPCSCPALSCFEFYCFKLQRRVTFPGQQGLGVSTLDVIASFAATQQHQKKVHDGGLIGFWSRHLQWSQQEPNGEKIAAYTWRNKGW